MLILSGLFRKAVVADNCALLANAAFSGKLGDPNLAVVLIGAYAFAWQIYGDFSGYSDMARGSAQLLGFLYFMVNFRQPYLSRSIQEFWRRWHISLSTWLRDYLYIGLGGNRHGEANSSQESAHHDGAGRPVAWRELDVRSLGKGSDCGGWLAGERAIRSLFGHRNRPQIKMGSGCFCCGVGCNAFSCFMSSASRGFSSVLHPSVRPSIFWVQFMRWSWQPEYLVAIKFLVLFGIPLFLLDLLLEMRDEEYVFEKTPEL